MGATFSGVSQTKYKLQVIIACLLAVYLILSVPAAIWAHPLGNFTVNRYSRLEVSDSQVKLFYILDMAEIPTQQEIAVIDGNRDGKMSDAEKAQYITDLLEMVGANLHLLLNDQHIAWQLEEHELEFPPGQADLPTLRLTARFVIQLPAEMQTGHAEYFDDNFADRLGWQEVIVQALPGAELLESSVPDQDLSQELRQYPEELLQSPANVNGAKFRFTTATAGSGNATTAAAASANTAMLNSSTGLAKPNDRFAELITIPMLGPGAIMLALLAAFGWGALHALSPGHGKTIVAAYLVGSRGTAQHALFLGLTTTITHTAGVFALGAITLFASRFILPEQLYPWLGLLSGLLVIGIGASLVWGRLAALVGFGRRDHQHHDHSHDHSHGVFHHHHHDDAHGHSHLPPGGDGSPVTWRNLLALGISGGLLPCPSALVLMLGAIALDRVAFGLLLILIFSLGLASVLTAIGILLVYAGQIFNRIPESNRLLRVMPVASAAFITLVGVLISWQALVQTGVLRLG
jgi:ABC-type nickel/cobalt efflux system permease component RcnA